MHFIDCLLIFVSSGKSVYWAAFRRFCWWAGHSVMYPLSWRALCLNFKQAKIVSAQLFFVQELCAGRGTRWSEMVSLASCVIMKDVAVFPPPELFNSTKQKISQKSVCMEVCPFHRAYCKCKVHNVLWLCVISSGDVLALTCCSIKSLIITLKLCFIRSSFEVQSFCTCFLCLTKAWLYKVHSFPFGFQWKY